MKSQPTFQVLRATEKVCLSVVLSGVAVVVIFAVLIAMATGFDLVGW